MGISLDAVGAQVPLYVKESGMTYPVVLDARGVAKEAYGVRGLPTTFLIDRSGVIRRKWLGFDDKAGAEVLDGLRELLQEKTGN